MFSPLLPKPHKKNSGYALYTAIILTGILLLVAYITAELAKRELTLSSASADSHVAFYNADTGSECALYWDVKNGTKSAFDPGTPGTISCNNQTVSTNSQTVNTSPTQPSRIGGGGANLTSIFELDFTQGCAIVSVTKNVNGTTFIQSKGYNTCTGANRLERGIEIQY